MKHRCPKCKRLLRWNGKHICIKQKEGGMYPEDEKDILYQQEGLSKGRG